MNTTPAIHNSLSILRSAVKKTRPTRVQATPKEAKRKMQVRPVLLPHTW
ncbi:hypothetical protein E2C01_082125 [Portunus trituberculatus]|uniref:Uncharacterized protein n=1 Tax=Portunus trituberculatus TaxID=210409 RepID=A0A5B7J2X5_PORTR|nr:hypothetical protein [Portunus trituberculatus]